MRNREILRRRCEYDTLWEMHVNLKLTGSAHCILALFAVRARDARCAAYHKDCRSCIAQRLNEEAEYGHYD